jgi:hypothetical protein
LNPGNSNPPLVDSLQVGPVVGQHGLDAGLGVVHLWRSVEKPNEVFFLLSISDMDRARAFTADPASTAAGERAGVLEGEIHYVEDVA